VDRDIKDGILIINDDVKFDFPNVVIRGSIFAQNIYAKGDIKVQGDINAFNLDIKGILEALNIKAYNIKAKGINARDINAIDIFIEARREKYFKPIYLDSKIEIKKQIKK